MTLRTSFLRQRLTLYHPDVRTTIKSNLRTMNQALTGVKPRQPFVKRLKLMKLNLLLIDIAVISAVRYRRNL